MNGKVSSTCNYRQVMKEGEKQDLVGATEDWNTSSVLTDRFILLQMQGKNIDKQIDDLKKECDQMGDNGKFVSDVKDMNSTREECAFCHSKLLSGLADTVTTDISIPLSSLHPPPLSALSSLPSGRNGISDQRQEHTSFLLDQIQQINAPPQSAYPVADICKRIRNELNSSTNITETVSKLGSETRISNNRDDRGEGWFKESATIDLIS
ncbi:hypothetical protein LSM04_001011 [Trypanosoma melophagium]|uniref:uncharacterized protein n=1 Tax=Trypanosoma melophagium TaxID=715481 RepID=UPI00351A9024|nr:hypothetical protein LSM04_001011 [Trypanosoma melophagium]